METKVLPVDEQSLSLARNIVAAGGLVAFGTETVYGLGADARNARAAEAVFRAKGRPMDNPLIVHLARAEDVGTVCQCSDALLTRLRTVMPAPLTVILPKRADIPYEVTAGLDTVGVRVPASVGARAFLSAVGVPIAAPSANTSTRPSPTTAAHVYDDLGGKIPLILDMGPCEVGLESTVVDMTSPRPRVLRLGGMTVERLETLFGPVEVPRIKATDPPLSPGMKYRHYAPNVPVRLFGCGDFERACTAYRAAENAGKKPVILAVDSVLAHFDGCSVSSLGADSQSAANLLFARLRALENLYGEIVTFRLPDCGLGRAFNNRIGKAAGGTGAKDV